IRHLVHERNARCQHSIGGIFRHFRGSDVHENDWLPRANEWSIELGHHTSCVIGLGSKDYAIGLHEIVYGRAFLEKLRIADDVKWKPGVPRDLLGNLGRRADGYRRFRDDDHLTSHVTAD